MRGREEAQRRSETERRDHSQEHNTQDEMGETGIPWETTQRTVMWYHTAIRIETCSALHEGWQS